MTDQGNHYAIAALKVRRATLAGEIENYKTAIAYREEQLTHLDARCESLTPPIGWPQAAAAGQAIRGWRSIPADPRHAAAG